MEIKYMKRAMELAEKGIGFTNPNPLVGAVIVKDNIIIGEGYHELYGGPHAEINAFNNATADVAGATMYVTLEPCSHFGKTPPCAKAIIEKGIYEVVIAMEDPNPFVSGKGIKMLKDNGVKVTVGVLQEEGKRLNEIFLKYITTGLPFCLLKTAMTLDGKIATHTGDSKWITNEESRAYVHKLRHRFSSVMVGIGTVLQDNPFLNTRLPDQKCSDPIRIIVDTQAKIPLNANVLRIDSAARAILITTELAPKDKLHQLADQGVEIITAPLWKEQVDLIFLMKALAERNVDSVLLEGGSELNASALQTGIIDKVSFFIAPKIAGGSLAKTPVGGPGIKLMKDAYQLDGIKIQRFGDDIMIEANVRRE
ncbi:MAG: riboflavin biosynthesis protein RibD [Herbinix sp.]|jgi:diaminohydroxyphosphoribosylaminopyrimidine deaminase/5-amino-6-(5-phosphoribosylamino)uracil reductase|nr:riboflavin biosynthesis protein RibD [Herbinix sp.]